MKTEDTKEVIDSFYRNYGNIEEIMKLLSKDIEWNIPGNESIAPWIGLRRGKEKVREFFEIHKKQTQSIAFNIENILVDGKYGVAIGDLSTRMLVNDKIFSSHFIATFTISDGLITNYLFSEDSWKLVEILRDSNQ